MANNPFFNTQDLFYHYTYAPTPKEESSPIIKTDLGSYELSPGYNIMTRKNDDGTEDYSVVAPSNTPLSQQYSMEMFNRMAETHAEPRNELTTNNNTNNFIKLNNSNNNRVLLAVEFFKSKGLSYNQSMGIVGNLMHESGDITLNNITNKGDGGTSFGMALWHDGKDSKRWTALKNYAKSIGRSENDFDTQLNFVWKELSENLAWLSRLKATTTIEGATKQFMNDFENPNRAKANLRARINNALSLKKYYG